MMKILKESVQSLVGWYQFVTVFSNWKQESHLWVYQSPSCRLQPSILPVMMTFTCGWFWWATNGNEHEAGTTGPDSRPISYDGWFWTLRSLNEAKGKKVGLYVILIKRLLEAEAVSCNTGSYIFGCLQKKLYFRHLEHKLEHKLQFQSLSWRVTKCIIFWRLGCGALP